MNSRLILVEGIPGVGKMEENQPVDFINIQLNEFLNYKS